MTERARGLRIGAACAAMLLPILAGCRRDEPATAGAERPTTQTAETTQTIEQPALPTNPEEEVRAIEPEVDEESGLEIRFGLRTADEREVADPVLSFARGDRVCLALVLASTPPGTELALRWHDPAGEELGAQSATLSGTPAAAAVCLPGSERLVLGSYSLELELSGRPVGGASFTVADARELPRRGGA